MHDRPEPTRTEEEQVPEHHEAMRGAGHKEPAEPPEEELDDA
jgi:hypothetical protein